MAREMKFWQKERESLYNLLRKTKLLLLSLNKAADQLHYYLAADLRLVFHDNAQM